MTSVKQGKPLPTDVVGKLERANELKEEGNEFFKCSLYKKAISSYGKSLAYTKGLPGSSRGLSGVGQMASQASQGKEGSVTAEEERRAIDIETAVETNIATCYLKLMDAKQALMHAENALTLSSTSWKAMLRKAEAMIMLRNYDAAKGLLTSALTHVTDESWIVKINKEFSRIAGLERKEDEQQRKAFAGIFDKANKS